MNTFDKVSIIGVGLLGGSLAKAMRQRGLAKPWSGMAETRPTWKRRKS